MGEGARTLFELIAKEHAVFRDRILALLPCCLSALLVRNEPQFAVAERDAFGSELLLYAVGTGAFYPAHLQYALDFCSGLLIRSSTTKQRKRLWLIISVSPIWM